MNDPSKRAQHRHPCNARPPAARKFSFAPVVDDRARVLILGTLPGGESLRKMQYYGHPQNQFWRIVYGCFGKTPDDGYMARLAFVQSKGIAIWDVLASAERNGSLDAAIKNGEANDFFQFLSRYSQITSIGFNGQKAQALFVRHAAANKNAMFTKINRTVLPSTSPAATRPYQEKIEVWRAFLNPVKPA